MIKSKEACNACRYGADNRTGECRNVTFCQECSNYTNEGLTDVFMDLPTVCRCMAVRYGEECPYYREDSDDKV